MARHLIPSNATIKAIREGDPRSRLNDGDGLCLRLFVKGGSHSWRFDYTFDGRRKTLSFGTYPDTTLSLARKLADEARQQVRNGIDPSELRRQAKKAREQRRDDERRIDEGLPPAGSFEEVAREWYAKNAPNWAPSHSEKIIQRLARDIFAWIGKKPIELIPSCDRNDHRVQQNCGQVLRYAVATGRAESDPSRTCGER